MKNEKMKEWLIVLTCVLFSLFILSVQASNTVNFPFTNVNYYGVDQTGANSIFGQAVDMMFTPDGSSLLAVDYNNNRIYKFYEANLLNYSTFNAPQFPRTITFAAPNTYLLSNDNGLFKTSDLATFTKLTDDNPAFGVAYDQVSGLVYVNNGNNQVTAYNLEPFAVVRVYGGSSQGTSNSRFANPFLMAVDKQGGLWVADTYNNRVLHFAAGSTTADIVLGQPDFTSSQPAASASSLNALYYPFGVALDDSNDNLYVTDGYNRVMRYRGPFTSGQAASGLLDAQADFACIFLAGIRVRNNADGSVQVVFADSQKIVSGLVVPASISTSTASLSSTSTASVSFTSTASLSSLPSLTKSLSRTRSLTRTPSNSRSLSRSTSSSRSVSRTPSNSRSFSRTASITRSASAPPRRV